MSTDWIQTAKDMVLSWWRNWPSCNDYDVPGLEDWLEDQARRGRVLTGWRSFEDGFPTDCRFCLEPMRKKEKRPPAEKLDLCARAGWEYVGYTGAAFHIWRSTVPDPAPLRTDPTADSYAYEHLWRKTCLFSLLSVLFTAAMAGFVLLTVLDRGPMLLQFIEFTPFTSSIWYLVYMGVLLSTLLFDAVSNVLTLRRLLRSLRAGVPMERKKPVLSRRVLRRMYTVYLLTMLVALLVISGMPPRENLPLADDPVPFVAAEDLGGVSHTAYVVRRRTALGGRITQVKEGDSIRFSALRDRDSWRSDHLCETTQTVYDLTLDALAGPLLRDIAGPFVREDGGVPAEPLETALFDEAYYVNTGTVQHLAARSGGRVLYYRTAAPEDLRERLAGFAAVLADTSDKA